MSSSEVVIGLNATRTISQMPNNATSIGSSAGSVICQLPNNATSIGESSLSSNTQISFSGEPAGQGPVGVNTNPADILGPTGPPSESTIVLEKNAVNNGCCVKWY